MAGLRQRALGLIAPGGGESADRWDRVPVLIAALLVIVPAAFVPVMGIMVVLRTSNGVLWNALALCVTSFGVLGLTGIAAGAVVAAMSIRSPIPAVLVAGGTTVALAAAILLVPIVMAGG